MRDMFDDFMEELRKRQAEQQKKAAGEPGEKPDSGSDQDGESTSEKAGNGKEEQPVTAHDSGREEPPDEDRDIFGGSGGGAGGGGPRRPRYVGPEGEMPEIHIGRGWVIVAAVVVGLVLLLTLFFSAGVGIWTDAIWYQSVGYADVFWTRIGSQVGLFILGLVFSLAFLWANLYLAGRLIPKGPRRRFSLDDFLDRFNVERYSGYGGGFGGPRNRRPTSRVSESVAVPDLSRPVFWGLLALGLLVALGFGALFASNWTTVQLFNHRVPFGQVDPTFGRDIGFYIFELPFYRLFQSYANSLLFMAMLLTGLRYLVAVISGASMPTSARVHFGVIVMLYLFSAAVGFQLDRFSLVYSQQSGIFQGVSYTDANAKFLALNAMTALAAFAGALFLFFCFSRWWLPLAITVGAWLVLYVGLGAIYPAITQQFVVNPNQQNQETPFIKDNMDMTRLAFDLGGWQSTNYQPAPTISQKAVTNEPGTILNVRLWDTVPLQKTLDGVQVIRNYYTFTHVNTDRYTFTDAASCSPAPAPCVRQVMLAGRELDPSQLTDQSWVNEHITYTHGVGLAMVPINEVGGGGQPNLLISNLPPTSTAGTPTITESRIYFGLQESNYVIVDAASQEFDYPSEGGDKYTSWAGTSGIKLDTPLMRLLFAARFGDLNMLISNQITGGSQLLFNRSITDRVQALAPFLRYDNDPYLVVGSNGKLFYVLDAYTTTDAFPDSQPYDPSADSSSTAISGDPFNYIRNSVKVVMNAYDGSTTFYVADPKDPLIRAWEGVFPDLFKPISEMSSDLQAHIRYPQGILEAQATQYGEYHVTDPGVFYQKTQFWQIPQGGGAAGGPEQLPLESFYVEMHVPGQPSDDFMLLQPMVLQKRNNMIAWVAAYNDYPEKYGQISVFDFPESSNVFGPVQMQALIQQNQGISQQITLWEGAGSHVVLGNLLVIPLEDTLMYVEPVYLQAQNSPLPVFQRVVVGTPTQVVWGTSLSDALNQIYAGQGTTGPSGSPTPTPAPSATAPPAATSTPAGATIPPNATAQQLIALANQHYQAAQQALRNGDLATYQKEMNEVGQILAQLENLLGTPAPSP